MQEGSRELEIIVSSIECQNRICFLMEENTNWEEKNIDDCFHTGDASPFVTSRCDKWVMLRNMSKLLLGETIMSLLLSRMYFR